MELCGLPRLPHSLTLLSPKPLIKRSIKFFECKVISVIDPLPHFVCQLKFCSPVLFLCPVYVQWGQIRCLGTPILGRKSDVTDNICRKGPDMSKKKDLKDRLLCP